MRGALPMYDWPEAQAGLNALWARLQALVPELPAREAVPTDEGLRALWVDPDLLLTECCWGPIDAGLVPNPRVLAQTNYDGILGGTGPCYRSAIVARGGRTVAPGARALLPDLSGLRIAANAPHSRSGWRTLTDELGFAPPDVLWTGAHRASVRAVAEGAADVAAIDCRSWALALAHEPGAAGLTVVGWSAPKLGQALITGRNTPDDLARRLTEALLATGALRAQEEPVHA